MVWSFRTRFHCWLPWCVCVYVCVCVCMCPMPWEKCTCTHTHTHIHTHTHTYTHTHQGSQQWKRVRKLHTIIFSFKQIPLRNVWTPSPPNYVLNSGIYFLQQSLVWFNGTSTIAGYLMPNLFLYKWTVLFKTIQFSISIVFFVDTQLNVKTVLFQVFQLSLSTQLNCRKQFYFKQFS